MHLNKSLKSKFEIIIVDSTDYYLKLPTMAKNITLNYIHTQIKSAAIQRNIGLKNVKGSTRALFFLDDDTFPTEGYFEKLESALSDPSIVGVSGIGTNPIKNVTRNKPSGILGAYYRLFLLDSMEDGVLLKSGINIPVRQPVEKLTDVDWLFTCSCWRFCDIGETQFEPDFQGASIGEDVIFSMRMRKKGRLIVDGNVILHHIESQISRPTSSEFWIMWMVNRYRIVEVGLFGVQGKIAFWWSTFGQIIINIYSAVRNGTSDFGQVVGILKGAYLVIKGGF
jgi:glycosyltransferase involved in cell wall biosynthesis